jgi:hypothetical protein
MELIPILATSSLDVEDELSHEQGLMERQDIKGQSPLYSTPASM